MRVCSTLIFALSALPTPTYQQQNPQVDLGYEIHEGFYNVCLADAAILTELTMGGFDQPIQVR